MVLAHGGTAGGLAEAAVLFVPLVVLAVLGWRARRATSNTTSWDEDADDDEGMG